MGLFGKKEACPVCGSEVKGLLNKKIADKKTLCKECSNQVSMTKELLKTATPEFMKAHLEYRQKNALKFTFREQSSPTSQYAPTLLSQV